MVGDVYVRIYNEQPSFLLESFEQFAIALLGYLRRTGEILYKNMTPEVTAKDWRACAERTGTLIRRRPTAWPRTPAQKTEPTVEPRPLVLERTEQSLTALYNVIKIFPDATLQTLNRYKLLFYFMRVDESPGVQMAALNVIHLVVANKVGRHGGALCCCRLCAPWCSPGTRCNNVRARFDRGRTAWPTLPRRVSCTTSSSWARSCRRRSRSCWKCCRVRRRPLDRRRRGRGEG